MQMAWQGLIPCQISGPTGLEGQSKRTEVGGQGPGSIPWRHRIHPHVREGSLWPGPCFFSWGPQTTALDWGWSWENRSWARLGRLRLSGRSQVFSVHQLLAAEDTSAWIPGNLGPSEIVSLCLLLPLAGAVRAGHSCCLEGGVGGLTTSPGSSFGLSFPPLSSLRQCGRPNGELPQRTPDGVAGVSAAAVRAPGHHRVCCGGGRGVSEAAGTEQAFLLSSQPVAWGRALALM